MIKYLLSICLFLVTSSAASATLEEGYPVTDRTKVILKQGWKFHLGNESKDFINKIDDSDWQEVTVPHTLSLTSLSLNDVRDSKVQETFQRNVGWYRNKINVSSNSNKKVFLEFEGAHQVTDLWVNGQHIGQHRVSGYSPFIFDISRAVNYGKSNQITLRVDNTTQLDVPPDPGPFDFIKFGGLYRDVYLVETNKVRVSFNIEALNAGITITTPSVDPVNLNATVNIKTVVKNELNIAQDVTLINRIVDHTGAVVERLTEQKTIAANSDYSFNQIGGIENNARLWSVDDPYLYKVNTVVMVNGKPVDVVDNNLGLRTFELDPELGFKLNGKPIEIVGFNRHQHYGYIGDALPDSLHVKDMQQFKKMGFNMVRTAHYPQDDALIEACDKLGILVYTEAPTWTAMPKEKAWWNNLEQSARIMVRNNRNNPSVVIWGAGINHRGYVPQMQYAIKQEDPTRLTASQSSRWTGWQASGLTDIYANMLYGPGDWKRNEPMFAMEGFGGPAVVAEYKRDAKIPGILTWTAHAYYTFHDIGNLEDRTRLGYLSSFRSVRDPLINWYPSELRDSTYLHVDSEWKEGIDDFVVYSNVQEIALVLNGQSLGKFKPSKALLYQGLDHPPFEVPVQFYQPGKMEVIGLIDGKEVAKQTVYTPGKPHSIRLRLDSADREFIADGNDIVVGYAEIIDKNGMLIKDANVDVSFRVRGDATIIGDNADIDANPAKVRLGTAPVLIRAGYSPGTITVKATAKGLRASSVKIKSTQFESDMLKANAYAIQDYKTLKVDIGSTEQLVQFGWTAWEGNDNEPSEQTFSAFGGFSAKLNNISNDGLLRWLGEMNVIGFNGYTYGEGVLAIDKKGLKLSFIDLPKGKYTLKTFHHAPRTNTDSMDPNKEKLKTLSIHKIPYSQKIYAQVLKQKSGKRVIDVSQGKSLQWSKPGQGSLNFSSNGKDPINIVFSPQGTSKGVWLNAFELTYEKNMF
ncbi:glycoside hydrolase family 2 protein [Thalassotalea sp. PLHSN55]|uniref:glycoside hydrolase family 2 protein n=1 Tax=Thalassotalea sp. PLHSN55 TaxID=3435888 RepID=UPI003F84AE05